MQVAIIKAKQHVIKDWQDREGYDVPMPVFYAGSRFLFSTEDFLCEFPLHYGRGMVTKRGRDFELVEIKDVQQNAEPLKVNRKNSEHFLCSFCDKPYQMVHHRNNHEAKCKGD